MIDPIYRQQLQDQIEQARYLLDQIAVQAKLFDLLTDSADRERAVLAGLNVSEFGVALYELAPDLCDTAARFDLVALQEVAQ